MGDLNTKCDKRTEEKFSEALYQEMVSNRYGISFCCQPDLENYMIKKELNNLVKIKDDDLVPMVDLS